MLRHFFQGDLHFLLAERVVGSDACLLIALLSFHIFVVIFRVLFFNPLGNVWRFHLFPTSLRSPSTLVQMLGPLLPSSAL